MKKSHLIIILILAFISSILLVYQSRKEKPRKFFTEEVCSDAKYFKFYKGGKTICYPNNDVKNIKEIKDIVELDLVCNML